MVNWSFYTGHIDIVAVSRMAQEIIHTARDFSEDINFNRIDGEIQKNFWNVNCSHVTFGVW